MNAQLSFDERGGGRPRVRLGLLLLLAVGAGACSDDQFTEERPNPGAPGTVVLDAGGDAEISLCPAEPKVGENCPSDEESQLRCTYIVGTCNFAGSTYDITLDYCCQRGVQWESCGTNTTPCDQQPPDAATASVPVPDAGAGQ